MSKNKKSQKPKKKVVDTQIQPSAADANLQNQENEVVLEETSVVAEEKIEESVTSKDKVAEKEDKKKENIKDSKKNAKKKDKKEKGKMKRKAKETISELKKVTWPTFGEVCKKTGVVLVVVIVFAVVIFGIDYCLGLLMGLLR